MTSTPESPTYLNLNDTDPACCPYCSSPRVEVSNPEDNDTHVEFLCHTWWDSCSAPWVDPVCDYIRCLRFSYEHPGLHLMHEHTEDCGCTENQAEEVELRGVEG